VKRESLAAKKQRNEEDDPTRLYCVCKKPYHMEFMIGCDNCEEWYHPKCVNFKYPIEQAKNVTWYCPNCIGKMEAKKRKNPYVKQKLAEEPKITKRVKKVTEKTQPKNQLENHVPIESSTTEQTPIENLNPTTSTNGMEVETDKIATTPISNDAPQATKREWFTIHRRGEQK